MKMHLRMATVIIGQVSPRQEKVWMQGFHMTSKSISTNKAILNNSRIKSDRFELRNAFDPSSPIINLEKNIFIIKAAFKI